MAGKGRRSHKINKVFCGECNLEIEEEEEFIQCDKCNKKFHALCTQLDKPTYEYLLKNGKEEYICHKCNGNNNNNGTITKELNDIKRELKKLNQLSQLTESVNFMSNQFDMLMKSYAENKKKVEAVERENKMLKNENETLKYSVKYLNDQRVKNDCIISGISVTTNETAIDTVVKLATDAGVNLLPNNIEDAYFLHNKKQKENKKGQTKTVVVKFNAKEFKQKLMSVKPKLKEQGSSVYVSDFLSKESLALLNYAKTLKSVGFRAIYATDGKIFCKKSELSKPKLIRSEEDVDNMLLDSATNKPRTLRSRAVPAADDEVDQDVC